MAGSEIPFIKINVMKKIVLIADTFEMKPGIIDFVAYIANLGKSKITAIFVEHQVLETNPSIKTLGGQIYVEEITLSPEERRESDIKRKQRIDAFKQECLKRNIDAVVHTAQNNALKTLIHETRYADLAILDPAISDANEFRIPSNFAIELLNHTECPVLIAPEVFDKIDDVVLAYDGSKSSVFAIKQFYYQLPELAGKNITVLHISENNDGTEHEVERGLFKEWLDMHFAKATAIELNGDAREELYKYFMEHEQDTNKILVTGAFGRNFLSTLFKPSTAELVLKVVDIPMFIAHH